MKPATQMHAENGYELLAYLDNENYKPIVVDSLDEFGVRIRHDGAYGETLYPWHRVQKVDHREKG